MSNIIDKAYAKVKSYLDFSPNYETFESLFFENLQEGKEDLAIELLLKVVYRALKSDGEMFNELMAGVDEETQKRLKSWLESSYQEKIGGRR